MERETMSVLEAKDIEVCYHTREGVLPALRHINFTLEQGEIIGVVGESGCGKSSLAFTVNALLPPNAEVTGGSISFLGNEVISPSNNSMSKHWGTDVSMIFQDPMASLNPVFTIEEQLMTALRAQTRGTGASLQSLRERMFMMLEKVGIPDASSQMKEYPHQFSGGMRQRIMIAIALLSEPSLLIADEPTSALDVTLEAQINDLMAHLIRETGTSVLYITHDLGVVAQICDKVMVMYGGEVVEFNDVHSLFENPQHPYTMALLDAHPSRSARNRRLYTIPGRVPSLRELPAGCKFSPRCEYSQPICEEREPEEFVRGEHRVLCHFAEKMESISTSSSETDPTSQASLEQAEDWTTMEPIVSATGLKVHFKDRVPWLQKILGQKGGIVRAVDGVDIIVPRGQVLALVGESGSGKTTAGRSLLRLQEPTEGEITLGENTLTNLSLSEIRPMREKMQIIFQDPVNSLSPRMKVSSLLTEPFVIHNKPLENPQEKVKELLHMVGLSTEQADKYPHQLSGGQARRVSIARALALNPEIIIADEPTAGLDVSVAAGILNLMKDLKDELQLTYVVITHDLNVVSYIADRIAVMYLGKFVEAADSETLFTKPRHPYTEALLSAVSIPDPKLRGDKTRIILEGETPSPRNPPSGCPFHTRCRYAFDRCKTELPPLQEVTGDETLSHVSACHLSDRIFNGV
ncbi:MAG: dipeptide ABC transporter ATP-binding protein [Spirochaetota bacterium]